MKVFIVRPFGNRPVLKKDKATGNTIQVMFDFDKVEAELIRPAFQKNNLTGGTTGEVSEAGEIREDMFSELLLADMVIADVSVYNANVFYELGVRHALRDKRTVMIKATGFDETPFDITGYRYVAYDKDKPADCLPDLIKAIAETMASDRKDSPVFNMLPALKAQDTEKLLAVPEEFGEEVNIATKAGMIGKLKLLINEAKGFAWEMQANRYIGESFFRLKALRDACGLWEKIKDNNRKDLDANDRLSTIYQRLAENEITVNPQKAEELLAKSDEAINIILDNYDSLDMNKRAEVYALKARNAKARWNNEWKNLPDDKKELKAMGSANLEAAYESYERGYYENLNHYYSGINALSLLTIIIGLAKRYSNKWTSIHDEENDEWKIEKLETRQKKLAVSIQFSLDAERKRLKEMKDTPEKKDRETWFNVTDADFTFLTSADEDKVATKYEKALENEDGFPIESAEKQLRIYESLNILPANTKAALDAISRLDRKKAWDVHYLLFTGHMIDKADRKEPRFPASKEAAARQKIKEKILETINDLKKTTKLLGIAGGACGGDILFHEVCQENNIKTQLLLAMPREDFIVESVAFAGPSWISRFDKLYDNPEIKNFQLSDKKELPKWLRKKKDYNIWMRNNLWELNSALINGGQNMTLIALWDGKGGDGPGGTEHMVKEAESRGAKVFVIDTNQL